MNKLTPETFWQYACKVYSQNGMQPQLLKLQDTQQKNVNLCLLLLFLEHLQLQLTELQFRRLKQHGEISDQQLLHPHRLARSNLKQYHSQHSDYPALREQLLKSELMLEQLQQKILLDALPQSMQVVGIEANNLHFYLSKQEEDTLRQTLLAAKS